MVEVIQKSRVAGLPEFKSKSGDEIRESGNLLDIEMGRPLVSKNDGRICGLLSEGAGFQ